MKYKLTNRELFKVDSEYMYFIRNSLLFSLIRFVVTIVYLPIRFIDFFRSDRYSRVMDYLASPYFDAQTMMGTLAIQHYVSVALDNHIKGVAKITPQLGPKPLHVNFL